MGNMAFLGNLSTEAIPTSMIGVSDTQGAPPLGIAGERFPLWYGPRWILMQGALSMLTTAEEIQLTLGLLTIVASGVVSGVVTFRLNAGRDARRMRREKLEKLFIAHTGFLRQLEMHWYPYLEVMAGRILYNDALDIISKNSTNEDKHFENLEMLVFIYFPELEPGLRQLTDIRNRAAQIIGTHKREYERVGPHPTPAHQDLRAAAERLEAHCLSFRADMVKVAQKLGAPSERAA